MQQQASIQRLQLGKAKLALPLGLFLSVACAYVACIAAILIEPPSASLILVPVCGTLVVMLFVIGHDACHQSFTSSPLLNHIIGRMAFLPAAHSFSLWDREHNLRHHRFNNIKHLDYAWIPLTPREFAHARGNGFATASTARLSACFSTICSSSGRNGISFRAGTWSIA